MNNITSEVKKFLTCEGKYDGDSSSLYLFSNRRKAVIELVGEDRLKDISPVRADALRISFEPIAEPVGTDEDFSRGSDTAYVDYYYMNVVVVNNVKIKTWHGCGTGADFLTFDLAHEPSRKTIAFDEAEAREMGF